MSFETFWAKEGLNNESFVDRRYAQTMWNASRAEAEAEINDWIMARAKADGITITSNPSTVEERINILLAIEASKTEYEIASLKMEINVLRGVIG